MKTAGITGRMSTTSPVFEKGWELMEEARFMERTNHLAENLLEIQRERGMKLAEFSRELGLYAAVRYVQREHRAGYARSHRKLPRLVAR